jgi:sugar phosphate isomerase/epimerase
VTHWLLSGFGDEIDPDPVVQLAVLAALGARHIEVRSAWGTNVVELSDDRLDALAGLVADRGMGVSAVGSPIGKVDIAGDPDAELARLERAIAAAHRLDTRYIRIFSFYRAAGVPAESIRDAVLDRLRTYAGLAARNDLVLLHENEKDIYGDVPARVLDLVESVGSPALRLAWDPANYVQVGVTPFTEGYAKLRPYTDYVQIKDALLATGDVVPAGEGDGQVRETVRALHADGFDGFFSMEPHLGTYNEYGALSGPANFTRATRAFTAILDSEGIQYR